MIVHASRVGAVASLSNVELAALPGYFGAWDATNRIANTVWNSTRTVAAVANLDAADTIDEVNGNAARRLTAATGSNELLLASGGCHPKVLSGGWTVTGPGACPRAHILVRAAYVGGAYGAGDRIIGGYPSGGNDVTSGWHIGTNSTGATLDTISHYINTGSPGAVTITPSKPGVMRTFELVINGTDVRIVVGGQIARITRSGDTSDINVLGILRGVTNSASDFILRRCVAFFPSEPLEAEVYAQVRQWVTE